MTTTTTTPTSSASTAATVATAVNKRPLTLTMGAAILLLAALLTFAFPFIPRGRGFFGAGNRPAGARQAGQNGQGGFGQGQGNDQGGGAFTQGNGQGGGSGGGGGQGGGGFTQGGGQANGQGGVAAGRGAANIGLFRLMAPVRITIGVIGGLFTLLAAWGIWLRKKWGMVLALIAAAAMLLTGAFSISLPLLGRTVTRALGSALFFTGFIAGAEWLAIVGIILALAVAVLVLLPASQRGYVSRPKERRVM